MITETATELDPADGMPSRAALAKEVLFHRISQFSKTFYEDDWVEDIEFDFWDLGHQAGFEIGGIQATDALAKQLTT